MKRRFKSSANDAPICTTLWSWTHLLPFTRQSHQPQFSLVKMREVCFRHSWTGPRRPLLYVTFAPLRSNHLNSRNIRANSRLRNESARRSHLLTSIFGCLCRVTCQRCLSTTPRRTSSLAPEPPEMTKGGSDC